MLQVTKYQMLFARNLQMSNKAAVASCSPTQQKKTFSSSLLGKHFIFLYFFKFIIHIQTIKPYYWIIFVTNYTMNL